MRILLIEDEDGKSSDIEMYFHTDFPEVKLDITKSFTTAIKNIYSQHYDLILLDMSLPFTEAGEANIENNEFEVFGGLNILDELKRINYNTAVLVITAYDILGENENAISLSQLNEKMKSDYTNIYIGSIYYNSSSIEWKALLRIQIEKMSIN